MATEPGSRSQLPSSLHRLPTVSAAQALEKLRSVPTKNMSTGLPRLDSLLAQGLSAQTTAAQLCDAQGFGCGHVADIYGPPGSGKTAFCLQATVSALVNGHAVIWIDCGTPIPKDRMKHLLLASAGHDIGLQKLREKASQFYHYTTTDLAHLLTMFIHPTPDFISENTALVVIDSISTVFDIAYSRAHDQTSKKKSNAAKWYSSRKYAVMGDLISRLQKLATINNIVVLMTQQTRMRIRSGAGALLLPVLSGHEWDNGISTQLVLFRDFPPRTTTQPNPELLERWGRLRFVGVLKVNGVSAERDGRFDTVVPFSIEKVGLSELPQLQADVAVPVISSPARASKRRFEEIADSEGENELELDDDYGLDEDIDFESGLGGVGTAS